MSSDERVQGRLWPTGRCRACLASPICGAEETECHPEREYSYNEVLRPDHPDLLSWVVREARGLRFDDVVAVSQSPVELPSYVPQVELGIQLSGLGLACVALSLKCVLSSKWLLPATTGDVRVALQLPSDAKVVLLGIGKDDLIERVWGRQADVFGSIKRMRFDLVTAVNYSVWFSEPRLEHLVNMKRSVLTFERLQDLGVTAVPHVYWYNTTDLQRWADWLCQNDVDMIAINTQTARQERVWERLLRGMEWMAEHFPERLRYLFIGPSTRRRIDSVRHLLRRVSFSNKDAYMLAIQRQCSTWNGEELGKVACDAQPADIFRHNVALMSRVVSGDSPPPFTRLDGFGATSARQMTLPGVSEVPDYQSSELALLTA